MKLTPTIIFNANTIMNASLQKKSSFSGVLLLLIPLVITTGVGCYDYKPLSDITVAGENGPITIPAAKLERGRKHYMTHCYACHGEKGDGRGPAAAYLRPVPRDFRLGVFKFGLTKNADLPHNRELIHLVQKGLNGSAMLPWDLSYDVLDDVVDYIKTFKYEEYKDIEDDEGNVIGKELKPNRWEKTKKLGKTVVATLDPWRGKSKAAIARGEAVYHVNAQCRTCHPSYLTQEEFYNVAVANDAEWAYGPLKYDAYLRDSDWDGVKILPPDFTHANVKNYYENDSKEAQRKQLFRVIGAGVGGANMPTWKDAITDKDLWALSYYVQHLIELKGTKEGYALKNKLIKQKPFTPPVKKETASITSTTSITTAVDSK